MARKIGIMQGRLSPPVGAAIQAFPLATWREEFFAAKQVPLHHIEWIFDTEDSLNPIANDAGIAEIKSLSRQCEVKVNSLCADFFMSELLLGKSPVQDKVCAEKLGWLLVQGAKLGIKYIVLPFVDRSVIKTDADKKRLIDLMQAFAPHLERFGVEFHLETSLPPAPFAHVLESMGSPFVKINYDTGNSASLGYDMNEEFAAYGEYIGSIHIKDRLRGAGTVPLGKGHVEFLKLPSALEKIDYQGDFVLQVARGETGDEISWARRNIAFLNNLFPQEVSS